LLRIPAPVALGLDNASVTDSGDVRLLRQLMRPTDAAGEPEIASGLGQGGSGHTCARRSSGQIVCWGNNAQGQLGDGTTISRPTPTPVPGTEDAVEVATGMAHTCIRRSSGQVSCWGFNELGQLGDGSMVDAVEISCGAQHTCARKASGVVVCWGNDLYVGAGDGGAVARSRPTAVPGVADAVEISCGDFHACARRSSGTVVCWGNSDLGQVGNGTMNRQTLTPAEAAGVVDAVEIATGIENSCARLSGGTVMCWGSYGTSGRIAYVPEVIAELTDAVEISAGGSPTPFGNRRVARRRTGAVVSWGLVPVSIEGL
jgi:alpha-tubulin suppressor-like RCC1 family protein